MKNKGISVGLFLLALFPGAPLSSREKALGNPPNVLREIVLAREPSVFEVKILLSSYQGHRLQELADPNRIVIDLLKIEDIKASRYLDIGDFGIYAIRIAQFRSDMARVVFDVKEKMPVYKIELIPQGLRVIFPVEEAKQLKRPEPEAARMPKEDPVLKGEDEKAIRNELREDIERREKNEREMSEAIKRIDEKIEETRKALDQVLALLEQDQKERMNRTKNFIRAEALLGNYQPRDEALKGVYKNGLMTGAELSVGIWDMVELWASAKNFSRKAPGSLSGEDRNIRLIPFEAGIKFRLNKGQVNPYVGLGAGYYQYRESLSSREVRGNNTGFIGQGGCFMKMGGYLVVDVYAHYSYSRIKVEGKTFNAGGLQLGLGLGFEF